MTYDGPTLGQLLLSVPDYEGLVRRAGLIFTTVLPMRVAMVSFFRIANLLVT